MDNQTFLDKLTEHVANEEFFLWVDYRSLEETWAECQRGDWMLWLALEFNMETKKNFAQIYYDFLNTLVTYPPRIIKEVIEKTDELKYMLEQATEDEWDSYTFSNTNITELITYIKLSGDLDSMHIETANLLRQRIPTPSYSE